MMEDPIPVARQIEILRDAGFSDDYCAAFERALIAARSAPFGERATAWQEAWKGVEK